MRDRLQGRYPLVVAFALLALVPNSVLTTAYTPILPVLTRDLDASEQALEITEGLSNAGLALGAVFAAYLAQRFVQRRLFLGYVAAFVVGSCLAAAAPGLALFSVGRVLQGTATGLMIISALPVLVTRFAASRLPLSVVFVDVALFGATTAGPLLAGPVAASGAWRALFWGTAAIGVLAWLTTLVGYEPFEPQDPGRRLDRVAATLAVLGTVLLFCATSVLPDDGFGSVAFWLPFAVGLSALVALVVVEYRAEDPMVPVRALSTQLPVTGTVVAMVGGAVFVAVLGLVQLYLADVAHAAPTEAAVLFWPMPLGLLVSAVLFGVALPTRWLPTLVNAGLLAMVLGALTLLLLDPADPSTAVLPAAALLGFGAGASVSPGLFLAAMGVPSVKLGRAFALVLLLRAAAAYAVAPIVLHVAESGTSPAPMIGGALVAMAVLAAGGLVAAVLIPAVSGARLRRPDLTAWIDEGGMALPSPKTAVHARPGRVDDAAAPLVPGPVRRRGRRRPDQP